MNGDYNLKEVVLAAFEQLITVEESDAEKRPAPGKWSAKEIIGHLIDSASNNHGRFVRAQDSDELIGTGYKQDEWVTSQNYQAVNWHDLLILWRQFNLHIAHVMNQTPDSVRNKERTAHNLHQIAFYTIQENEATTLDYFMQDYVVHLKHHLGQVREVLAMDEE
ncbi:DinB family protein [Roseivirga sp. E12]|uniref:DinB family protein n=1 Tax=Roseivirga sp. E12 TaxID=2819237 RepID=UPI001ABD1C4C|nr:DinB family protein [Roseivirga sp. E12]MBO3699014.1 DinB family protein [Roseivirga sp. E12]